MTWRELINSNINEKHRISDKNLVSLIFVTDDFTGSVESIHGIAAYTTNGESFCAYFGDMKDDIKKYEMLADYLINPEQTLAQALSQFIEWLSARVDETYVVTFTASDAFNWTRKLLNNIEEHFHIGAKLNYQLLDLKVLYSGLTREKNPAAQLIHGITPTEVLCRVPAPKKKEGLAFIKSRLGETFPVVGESPKQRASDTIICTTHILNSDIPEFDD